jgi:ATP-dependent DNA ligase
MIFLDLRGPAWFAPETFDDGPALFAAVVEAELECIVAKRVDQTYQPGERSWVKIKNRAYWRFGQERELAQSRRRQRLTI